jgi:hypothetical protein
MQVIPKEDLEFFKGLTNEKITSAYTLESDRYGGKCTVIETPSKKKYWVKIFNKDRDRHEMELEYKLQNKAAQLSAAPILHWISTKEKIVVGEYIPFKLVNTLNAHQQQKIPFQLQTQIYSLCKRLDIVGVYHNNGNATNIVMNRDLQLDKETMTPIEPYPRLYMVGFRNATETQTDDINMKKTLFNITRSLGFNKFRSSGLYRMYSEFVSDGINVNVMTWGDNVIPPRMPWKPVSRPGPRDIPRDARINGGSRGPPTPRGGGRGPTRGPGRPPRGVRGPPRGARGPPRGPGRPPRGPGRPPRGGRGPGGGRGGPRGGRGPGGGRGGPRGGRGTRPKPPPRKFRVDSLQTVKETVFEGSGVMDCCDFEDLTERLSTKKLPESKKKVDKKKKKKKKALFEFNSVGDEAAIRKFSKRSNTEFLQTLNLDSIENVNLKLNLISKLWSQYKEKKEKNKEWGRKVDEETPTEEAWTIVKELIRIPLLEERIQVLRFKQLLHHDLLSISHTMELIHTNIDHVYTSTKLKQLLRIIVQAINQRLKDFAETEKLDFKDYKRTGVPAHDIITFMTQKEPMNIIAEKVLESGLELDTLDIYGLDQVRGDQITDQVLVPLKHLGDDFAKIQKLNINKLGLGPYIKSASEQLIHLETKSEEMIRYLQKTSMYLGENGNYLKIKDSKGVDKYDIISLVQTITNLWYDACDRAKKIIQKKIKSESENERKKPKSNNINEMMKQAMAGRRSSITDHDNEAVKWD